MSEQSEPAALLLRGADALGISLDRAQVQQFSRLADALREANARANLTSITDPDQVQVKHFVDALTLAPLLRAFFGVGGGTLVDVGAGAGLPGLALAIVLPHVEVTLLEATGKKAEFIARAVDLLGLANARVITGRAEDVARQPDYRERFDVAVARAVGHVVTLVELLIPLLRVEGRAILMKTASQADVELGRAEFALGQLRAHVERRVSVAIPGLLEDRVLVVVRKDGPTPDRYPRRNSLPQRRPLVES